MPERKQRRAAGSFLGGVPVRDWAYDTPERRAMIERDERLLKEEKSFQRGQKIKNLILHGKPRGRQVYIIAKGREGHRRLPTKDRVDINYVISPEAKVEQNFFQLRTKLINKGYKVRTELEKHDEERLGKPVALIATKPNPSYPDEQISLFVSGHSSVDFTHPDVAGKLRRTVKSKDKMLKELLKGTGIKVKPRSEF